MAHMDCTPVIYLFASWGRSHVRVTDFASRSNMQCTGLSFIGIGIGIILGTAAQPFWQRYILSELFTGLNRVLTKA
jgi:hypothetical protein